MPEVSPRRRGRVKHVGGFPVSSKHRGGAVDGTWIINTGPAGMPEWVLPKRDQFRNGHKQNGMIAGLIPYGRPGRGGAMATEGEKGLAGGMRGG